jgi:hypothetical protein
MAKVRLLMTRQHDDTLNEVRVKSTLEIIITISQHLVLHYRFHSAERRVELAGEGFRFFDLVRTGKALLKFQILIIEMNCFHSYRRN